MSMHTIRLTLVEDDQEMLDLIANAIKRESDMRVIATYDNGTDFLEEFAAKEVDVVIMDIGLPDISGIDLVARTKPIRPTTQFLMSTIFENPAFTFRALSAGATGYLLKNAGQEGLAEAIRDVHNGGSPMSPAIARLVVNSFQDTVRTSIQDHTLTEREKAVLDQLAQGRMYKEIAINDKISTETVRKHVRNIYEKLQVGSRMEALRKVYPGNRKP